MSLRARITNNHHFRIALMNALLQPATDGMVSFGWVGTSHEKASIRLVIHQKKATWCICVSGTRLSIHPVQKIM